MSNENEEKVFQKIHENYHYMNSMMAKEMDLATMHGGLTGNYREEMWVKFFRSIVPRKFSLAQGVMIIDSKKRVSNEVDIAVYDEQYTPYVFQYNALKFIPIEAVAMVIECKSASLDEERLRDWAENIDKLETSAAGIARTISGYTIGITNPTQKRTHPLKILACMKKSKTDQPMKDMKERLGDQFDFIIQEKQSDQRCEFNLIIKNESRKLDWWGRRLNGIGSKEDSSVQYKGNLSLYGVKRSNIKTDSYPELSFTDTDDLYLKNTLKDLKVEGNPLLSLNLQLNQLLMLINNPMMFPHFSYAKAFNDITNESRKKESE